MGKTEKRRIKNKNLYWTVERRERTRQKKSRTGSIQKRGGKKKIRGRECGYIYVRAFFGGAIVGRKMKEIEKKRLGASGE